jgi:formylglycine-generating enzyme required for sulfatase activity
VRKPAALPDARLSFDEGLVEELVFAVSDEAGALPLLQFTLELLFERRDGLRLTWDAYRGLGGVHGALANYAESVYDGLDDDGKRRARVLFLRLINPGATEQDTTRRRARLRELTLTDAVETDRLRAVADRFVKARLLTTDSAAGEDTIEVSHEALIREWKRLQDWLHYAREDIVIQGNVSQDANAWVRTGRPEKYDGFYRGDILLEKLAWAQRMTPSADELAFIEAGRAQSERDADAERDRRAERLRLAEDKAAAETRARIAESARATRARRAAVAFVVAAVSADRTSRDVAFIGLEIDRFSTLNAANVLLPLRTQTPGIFEPTLTAIAALKSRTPVVQDFDGVPMVEVPAGCFFMGSTLYTDTQPINQQCFDAPFWIGQTEVTNAQYRVFMDDGGYTHPDYWTDDGWTWRTEDHIMQPACWTESAYNAPNQPVVCVSWYEAAAYAAWLSAKLGYEARLPTEAEWEYAARGPDSLLYPWGNDWDPAKAVTNESGANAPALVNRDGSQLGASWVGARDMSGNVWEWTSSIYDQEAFPYPYRADDGREDVNSSPYAE